MRIFQNPLEMIKEVERDLFEMGIRVHPSTMQDKQVGDDIGYETVELFSYAYMVTAFPSDELLKMLSYTDPKQHQTNINYAQQEIEDRLSSDYRNPGSSWEIRRETWEPFLRDGTFSYTYNERIRTQFPVLIEELKKRPTTRQGIITMYDACKDMGNWGGKDRVPCSLYYQFYIRGDKVSMVYAMRSCDFLTHFPFDVFLAIELLEHVASEVGLEMGTFTHFLGSLHAYKKDMDSRGIF